MFDLIRDFGSDKIDDICGDKKNSLEENLLFVFPERYLSVHEQQSFMYNIERHKQRKKIKEICLITSSPLVIGSFVKECITIISSSEYIGG